VKYVELQPGDLLMSLGPDQAPTWLDMVVRSRVADSGGAWLTRYEFLGSQKGIVWEGLWPPGIQIPEHITVLRDGEVIFGGLILRAF